MSLFIKFKEKRYNPTMRKTNYKTIFFDWNKTLSHSLFWSQLADPKHERHNWHKNIVDFIFVKNRNLIDDWMRAKFDEKYVAKLISKEFGYSENLILKDLAESCRNMQLVSDEVYELIGRIRNNGTRCVIATDNMDTFLKYTKPALKLENYFDDFLISFEKKLLKFDVEENSIPFFDDYLKNNRLTYADVLLIDDRVDKSGTYTKLGFRILQITNSDDFLEKLRRLAGYPKF